MVIQIKVKYQLGFFIVIYRKEQMGIKYLILKQKASKGGWEFPKGVEVEGVSANKTIKGLIKNISGQVPYYIKKNSFYGKYKYSEVKKVGGEEFTGLKYRTYFAQIKETKVKLDIEKYIDFKWVDYRKAIQYLTWQNQRDCLKDVDDKLRTILHLVKRVNLTPKVKYKPKEKQKVKIRGRVAGKPKGNTKPRGKKGKKKFNIKKFIKKRPVKKRK